MRGSEVVDELIAPPRPSQGKLSQSALRAQAGTAAETATFQPARDSANGTYVCPLREYLQQLLWPPHARGIPGLQEI